MSRNLKLPPSRKGFATRTTGNYKSYEFSFSFIASRKVCDFAVDSWTNELYDFIATRRVFLREIMEKVKREQETTRWEIHDSQLCNTRLGFGIYSNPLSRSETSFLLSITINPQSSFIKWRCSYSGDRLTAHLALRKCSRRDIEMFFSQRWICRRQSGINNDYSPNLKCFKIFIVIGAIMKSDSTPSLRNGINKDLNHFNWIFHFL